MLNWNHICNVTAQFAFPSQTSRTAELPHRLTSSRNNLIVLLHMIVHTKSTCSSARAIEKRDVCREKKQGMEEALKSNFVGNISAATH